MIDTSILINNFRERKQKTTILERLTKSYDISISSIVALEYLRGSNNYGKDKLFLDNIKVYGFDYEYIPTSIKIIKDLKRRSLLISDFDLLIASTCVANNLPFATTNIKHFERIKDLNLLDLKVFKDGNLSGCHENKPTKKPLTKKEREQILSDLLKKSPKK